LLTRKDKIAAASKGGEVQLSEEEMNLLLKNTNMSRDQIVEFHQKFLQDCPSGILTKKEFVKMFHQLHTNEEKKKKFEKFCEYIFK
jgi:Ca2+-binding EF-hand superfamily protein